MKLEKLNEALEIDPPDHIEPSRLGGGVFATIRRDETDPHMVDKGMHGWVDTPKSVVLRIDENMEAGYFYAKWIMEHNIWKNNIHFPRIYDVKLIKRSIDEELKYDIKMERLYPISKLDTKELLYMLELYFGEEAVEFAPSNRYALMDILGDAIVNLIGHGIMHSSPAYKNLAKSLKPVNKKFAQAISMLVRIENRTPTWKFDLHQQNMMYRNTPFGPQLVFTDPFVGRNNSTFLKVSRPTYNDVVYETR